MTMMGVAAPPVAAIWPAIVVVAPSCAEAAPAPIATVDEGTVDVSFFPAADDGALPALNVVVGDS
jgi:hypothetical protein